MGFISLLVNEVNLQIAEMRQYWFETVSGLLFLVAMFLGLFYGFKSFAPGTQETDSLDGLLFGFLMWSFASAAYNSITRTIVEDTQKGYIEQLFLCPFGIEKVLMAKVLIESIVGILSVIALAYVVMWITGNWLDINFLKFYFIMMLAAPSLVGLGLIISGLALVYKRVEVIGAMLTIALMGLVAVDGLPFGPLSLLPFTAGSSLARETILAGQAMSNESLVIVTLNSATYMLVGLVSFSFCTKVAKRKNLIGQY